MKVKKINNQQGFTIVELIIATSIFSVMMLMSTTGLIYIGRTYYKGLISAKTQEATRSIVEEITREAQFSAYNTISPPDAGNYGPTASSVATEAICIGDMRYTKVVGQSNTKMGATDNPGTTLRHLLWVDKITIPSAPCEALPFNSATSRDLLSQNMRLTDFRIQPVPPGRYNISITIYYGDNDLVDANGFCVGSNSGGQFCARSSLETVATRRTI